VAAGFDRLVERFGRRPAASLSLVASFVVLAAGGATFAALLQYVVSGQAIDHLDRPVLDAFVRHRQARLTTVVETTPSGPERLQLHNRTPIRFR